MASPFREQLETAQEAARRAGRLIMDRQGSSFAEKGLNNLVTEADLAAQEAIVDIIMKEFPDDGILAEEQNLSVRGSKSGLWIIDPLDGTNNFAHGIPHYCISIAYALAGSVEAGVVFDPCRKEMFAARQGGGAFLNGRRIAVSRAAALREAVVATGFYYDRGEVMRKTLHSIEKLFEANIHGIRRFGSAALDLSWVACGRLDAYFEFTLSTWDFAAGMLLVEEAGGRCTDCSGAQPSLESSGLAVSNGRFHGELLVRIATENNEP